ncbi:MAG: helix-turn-helix domain-containing protein [Bdellovibrionales bacterium]|nr:helix-turn-helix domain-containing protein [Bdellovibrionales bacterium]
MTLGDRKLAQKIKTLRMEKKISQQELDRMCEFTISTIAKIENQKRKVLALELSKIASHLGVSSSIFFEEEGLMASCDELLVVRALRHISFENYQILVSHLESDLYFKAKAEKQETKKKIKKLVVDLNRLRVQDLRPKAI